MTVNQKVTGTASSMAGGLAFGGFISLAVTITGAILCGFLVSGEMIPESGIGYGSMVILLGASVLGAAAAAGKIKHRRLFVCGMSGVIYYGTLLAITALFFGGQYQGMGVTALVVLAGCGIVILLGMKQGRRGVRRRNKIRHR